VLVENRISIHSFLRESYAFAKKEWRAIVLPINNFLKDITQIDEDFQDTPNVISLSEAISGSAIMEENY